MRNPLRAILFAAFIGAAPAYAQGTAQERSDCMEDAFRLCSSDIPFVSKIETCLQSHLSQLSAGCRGEFTGGASKTKLRPEHFK